MNIGKISNATSLAERQAETPDLVAVGREWSTLSRASSRDEGWSRHTKVMRSLGGELVQVSTRQRNLDGSWAIAEALAFIPFELSVGASADSHNPLQILLDRLSKEGGEIVSSAACNVSEIEIARADGRLYVNEDSLGYVYFPPKVTVVPVTISDEEIAAAQAAQLGSEPVFQADGTVTTAAAGESSDAADAADANESSDAADANESSDAADAKTDDTFQPVVKTKKAEAKAEAKAKAKAGK